MNLNHDDVYIIQAHFKLLYLSASVTEYNFSRSFGDIQICFGIIMVSFYSDHFSSDYKFCGF